MRNLLAIVLVLILLSGCSGGGGGAAPDPGNTDLPPGEPAPSDPIPDTTTNLPTVTGGGAGGSSQIRTPMTTDPGS